MQIRVLKPVNFILLFLLIFGIKSQAQVFDLVVDPNGKGDYTTVQAAINSVPNYRTNRTLIFVKNGVYTEKVTLASIKTNISLTGENPLKTIISYDDNPTKNGMSSANTFTFWADGPGFYAENITFRNTAGNVGQALAIKTTGDTMVFKNCRFLGFQDTYYANKKRQYNLNCYIEGATDFVYGDATCVFDSCTINCVKGGQYISAPADSKLLTPIVGGTFIHGLLFRHCDITANADVPKSSYYLGRPWQPNSSSVFIQSKLGEHIKAEGWSTWGNNNHLSSYFAEYQNMNPDGSPADVSARVSWSYQLSDAWAANLYKLSFFLKSNNVVWDPIRITKELAAPKNFKSEGNLLTWDAVPNAKGYVVLKHDSTIGFSVSSSFTVQETISGATGYAVKSVSMNGALSKSSADISTAVNTVQKNNHQIFVQVQNRMIQFSEPVDFQIYSVSGTLIQSGFGINTKLDGIKNGIYLVKTRFKSEKPELTKIVINN